MIKVSLNLPKKLESHLEYLEIVTKRDKSFYIKEALTRYLEDLEDFYVSLERLEKKEKTYTTSELLASLETEDQK
jgi:RHH-type transcriptional regulator, rel operon repressor / antitoxin RelB